MKTQVWGSRPGGLGQSVFLDLYYEEVCLGHLCLLGETLAAEVSRVQACGSDNCEPGSHLCHLQAG